MPLTVDNQEQAEGLHLQGYGARRIAKRLGVPYGQVRRHLERRGEAAASTIPEYMWLRDAQPVAPETPVFRVVSFDTECTNLKSDLGVVLCAAFYDMHTRQVESKTIDDFGARKGGERALVRWIVRQYERADAIIGFNNQAFDRNYMAGVMARSGMGMMPQRIIIDLYQTARNGWKGLPSSYSLRNLSHFFGLTEEKESMDKEDWREALIDPEAMTALRLHCEADARVAALLWQKMKSYYFAWRGR